MVSIVDTLRDIQLFELKMLKDVVKVCDDNNIEYMLSSGTLLGAVRHGGFIPWDDDIDIYMTLDNYKKFLKVGQQALGEKYFVQNYETDKLYFEMWTQIRANGTTSMPIKFKNWNIHFGMCLDIFPLVGVSDNEKKRKKQKKALCFNRLLLMDGFLKATGENISSKMKLLYKIPYRIRKAICKFNERKIYLDFRKYDSCSIIWYDIIKIYPAELFKNLTKIKFEDTEFTTLSKYDEYLTILYGDYMTPPKESERNGHSGELGEIIRDTKKDYKEYKN